MAMRVIAMRSSAATHVLSSAPADSVFKQQTPTMIKAAPPPPPPADPESAHRPGVPHSLPPVILSLAPLLRLACLSRGSHVMWSDVVIFGATPSLVDVLDHVTHK